ncbi:hypothetical protein JCM11251_006857 [Rhodosporidiobolus azoricus]
MTSNLLSLPYKTTVHLPDLSRDLLAYLDAHSTHTHPLEVKADVEQWGRTRDRVFGREGIPTLPSQETADELSRYYAQLSFVLTKLPSSLPLSFPWQPLFPPPATTSPPLVEPTEKALEYERANVLYNMAACYAQMGAERRRGDEEGIKASLGYFQTAAGLLSHLLTLIPRLPHQTSPSSHPSSSSSPTPAPFDPSFHPLLLSSLQHLLLAQAQEVAWQKAVMDRLKNGTVAKIALKAAEWYALALEKGEEFTRGMNEGSRALEGAKVVFPWDLTRHLVLKHSHFLSVAHYRKSLDDLGANRYGDELGRLELADKTLREGMVKAGVAARRGGVAAGGTGGWEGVLDCVVRDLKSLQKIVSDNLARATKDNNLIYLCTPTSPSLLPPITSAALARPLLPPILSPPAPPPTNAWFRQLVPREVGEVIELWEDRKTEWVRGEVELRVRAEDQALDATLASLGLTQLLEDPSYSSSSSVPPGRQAPPPPLPPTVPPSLLEKAATVQAEGGVERLETMMKDVRRVAGVNQKMLQESFDLLSAESTLDSQHLSAHGSMRWTRTPSSTAAKPLRERAEQLRALLASAGESDALVRRKFGEWEEAVRALSGGEEALRAVIPAALRPVPTEVAPPPPSRDEIGLVRNLRALMEQLTDLRASRRRVVEAARTAVQQADIRDAVLREAEYLTRRGGEEEDGEEALGLAKFEELLGREMGTLRGNYEAELERLKAREEDLVGETKTAHSSLLSYRSGRLSASDAPPTLSLADQQQLDSRQQALAQLDTAFAKFVEMKQNLQEGLRFYAELSKLLGELRDGCKSFNYTRTAEAQDLSRSLSVVSPSAPSPRPARSPAPPQAAEPAPPVPVVSPTTATSTPRRKTAGLPSSSSSGTPATAERRTTRSSATSTTTAATRSRSRSRLVQSEEAEQDQQETEPAPAPVARPIKAKKTPKKVVEPQAEPASEWDPSQGIRFG